MKRRVLVIRFSSLGDIVMITGALRLLARAGLEVYVVTKKEFADLLSAQSFVAGVFPYDKSTGEGAAKDALEAWAKSKGIHAILDLHDSWRSWILRRRLAFLGPVVVCQKQRLREFAILVLRLGFLWGWGAGGRARSFERAAIQLLEVLKIRVPIADNPTFLDQPAGSQKTGVFVLVPGSAWASKRWDEARFAELAERLVREGPVLVLGGPKDDFCERIASRGGKRAQAVLGQPLPVVQKILAGARMVIGNDTGVVHMAEAMGVPAVVVEGPTHSYLGFTPYRQTTTVLGRDLICRPCSKTGAICWRGGSRTCLDISVDEVLEASQKLLKGQ